jgi:hypothetical protein
VRYAVSHNQYRLVASVRRQEVRRRGPARLARHVCVVGGPAAVQSQIAAALLLAQVGEADARRVSVALYLRVTVLVDGVRRTRLIRVRGRGGGERSGGGEEEQTGSPPQLRKS